MPDEYYSWANNEKRLQRAIDRNDIIKAASNPLDMNNIWRDGEIGGTRTIFGKEVELLEKNNYTYDANTKSFIKQNP